MDSESIGGMEQEPALDPKGPPQPIVGPLLGEVGKTLLISVLAGAGFVALAGVWVGPTQGATVSSRLEWERRGREIESAVHKAEIEQAGLQEQSHE